MQDTRRTIQAFLALQGNASETDFDLTKIVVQLAATTPAILYVFDLITQRSVFLNRRIFEALALAPESEGDEPSDLLTRLMHPDDLPQMRALLSRFDAATDDDILSAEYRLRHANGEWRWLSCRSVVFQRGAGGRPLQILTTAEDVTERRQTEQALRDKAAQLQAVMDTAVDAIVTIDERGTVETFNQAATRIFGYAADEVLGQNVRMLMPAPYHAEHNDYLRHYLETGERRIIGIGREVEGLRKDGTTVPLDLAVSESGAGRRVFTGFMRDLTERKEAQAAQRTQAERIQRFSERLMAMFLLTNDLAQAEALDEFCREAVRHGRSDLDFDRLSLWFTEETGWIQGSWGIDEEGSLRDERQSRLPITLTPQLMQIMSGEVQMHITEDAVLYNDAAEPVGRGWHVCIGLWDGKRVIGQLSADNLLRRQPWTEQDGELLRLFASHIGHLCTRKRLQEALRESEERFRGMFRDAATGIVVTAVPNGRFLRANAAYCRMVGYTEEEMRNMDFLSLTHPDDRARNQALMNELLAGERESFFIEKRYLKKDGGIVWVRVSVSIGHAAEGGLTSIIGIAEDVTEQKALQEQLFESQKLESMGRLAGGIAHDFNNLLTAILGYTELAQATLAEATEGALFLNNVSAAAERAAKLTQQLLMYARRQMVEFTSVDINEVILNMDPLLRRTIGEQYELVTLLAEDACCVSANVSQMEQVLTNLVVNARDSMPAGGRIVIETACATLDDEYAKQHIGVLPGDYVMYSVSDHGTGMTTEVRNRIFEPFFTTKQIGKGTGLGLATCYGIIKQSKGNIWVYSEPDKGTTFKVYLPRVRDAAHSVPVKLPDDLPEGTETVLVVDDEPMVRDIAARTLREQGYRVLEASNGAEALHLQSEWPGTIDLLLSDVVMPLMGGKELAQRLQEVRPTMKVLYMSGYTQNVVLQQGVLKPGVILLTKPFTAGSLLQKVREALSAG